MQRKHTATKATGTHQATRTPRTQSTLFRLASNSLGFPGIAHGAPEIRGMEVKHTREGGLPGCRPVHTS